MTSTRPKRRRAAGTACLVDERYFLTLVFPVFRRRASTSKLNQSLQPQPLLRFSVCLCVGRHTFLAIENDKPPNMSVVVRTAQDVAGSIGAMIEHTTNRLLPPKRRERALENLRAFSERNPKFAVSPLPSIAPQYSC